MRRPTQRIGIFGGTFDPPHLGHLIMAEEIRERFELREVYFMPSHRPPHKDRHDLTDATHRFAMTVAATAQNSAFVPSPIEVNRPGPSYSIDTLRTLREELGPEAEILFVAGLDSFLQIDTWKDWEDLLDLCHFIVVSRPGHRFDEIPDRVPERLLDRIVDLRGDEDPGSHLEATAAAATSGSEEAAASSEDASEAGVGEGRWRVFLSAAVKVDISSTEIRERVRAGRSIRYRVPPEVERYIRTHGLYREAAAREAS